MAACLTPPAGSFRYSSNTKDAKIHKIHTRLSVIVVLVVQVETLVPRLCLQVLDTSQQRQLQYSENCCFNMVPLLLPGYGNGYGDGYGAGECSF